MLGLGLSCLAEAPKYVFLFIGEGMGIGHIASTQSYLREKYRNDSDLLMASFPIASFCSTHSASWRVTDSAAGADCYSNRCEDSQFHGWDGAGFCAGLFVRKRT